MQNFKPNFAVILGTFDLESYGQTSSKIAFDLAFLKFKVPIEVPIFIDVISLGFRKSLLV